MTGFASPATSGFPACAASPVVAASGDCTNMVRRTSIRWSRFGTVSPISNDFRASDAMRELSAAAAGLTVPPSGESLFDLIEDA